MGAPLVFALVLLSAGLGLSAEPQRAEKAAPVEGLPAGLDSIRVRQRATSRPATPDLVAAVWRCPKCGSSNEAKRLLPEQPPFDKLSDVSDLILRVGLGQGGGWPAPRADACSACGQKAPEKPDFVEGIFFRYMPETGCDAVARLPLVAGKPGKLVWGRLDVSGAYDQSGELVDEAGFSAAFGRVLSVREAWAEIAAESIDKSKPMVLRAAGGYYLTCRKAGESPAEEARLAAELNALLVVKEGKEVFTGQSLPLTAADQLGLERLIPTYRKWLPGQWRQLAEGRVVAAAVVDQAAFRKLVERELAGVRVTVDGRRLKLGEFTDQLDLDEVLLRTVHAGLSPGEGLHQFVWPRATRLVAIERIGSRAREMLGNYEVSIRTGTTLVVREKPAGGGAPGSGRELAALSLETLAGSIDASVPGQVESSIAGLLGLDQTTRKIRPPKATDTRCACGLEAWLSRRPRPKGFFEGLGAKIATVEWRGVELAWSLDCPEHSRFLLAEGLPAAKELEARYDGDVTKASFQVVSAQGLVVDKSQARIAIGPDISAALAHPRLRRALVQRLKGDLPGRDMLFWAPTTNIVVISPQLLEGEVRKTMRGAALEMARNAGLSAGDDLDLEIREKLTEEPAGTFSAPPPPKRTEAGG